MSCYHPMLGIPDYDNPGSRYKLAGPFEPNMRFIYPGSVAIPCSKCLGCRLDYSRNWADRMMLEYDHTGKAIFVTLTYNDNNVPVMFDDNTGEVLGLTLNKEDFQNFMKRLRSRQRFENTQIRFYASGEYGSKTKRPHYHAIIFGISLEDFPDRQIKKVNRTFNELYTSKEFEDIWQRGFILLGDVSWKTCAYVSRYVIKKAFCELLPFPEAEPEFCVMSRRPGIGAYYLQDHVVDFEKQDIKVLEGGQKIKVPKYFIEKLESIDPVLYDKIKEDRQRLANDATLRRLQNTDLTFQQALKIDEEEKIRRTKILQRGDV